MSNKLKEAIVDFRQKSIVFSSDDWTYRNSLSTVFSLIVSKLETLETENKQLKDRLEKIESSEPEKG